MTSIHLTGQEMVIAATIGIRRRIDSLCNGFQERNGAANASISDQWYWNVLGACGELAVAKSTGRYWAGAIGQKKTEADIGPDIQVRTRGNQKMDPASVDLIVREDDSDHFRYVLVLGHPPDMIIAGWIWGFEAKQKEWFGDNASRNSPVYWVPQSALHPIVELI